MRSWVNEWVCARFCIDQDDAIRSFYWDDWRLPSKQYSKREWARSHSMFIYFDSCVSYFNSEYIFIALFSLRFGSIPVSAKCIRIYHCVPLLSAQLQLKLRLAFTVIVVHRRCCCCRCGCRCRCRCHCRHCRHLAVAISIAIFSFKCTFYLHSIRAGKFVVICISGYFIVRIYVTVISISHFAHLQQQHQHQHHHATYTHTLQSHSLAALHSSLVSNLIYHLQY